MAPRRSIQQATGDEGELAFAAALPKLWVPRKENPDYGIDSGVEIVNRDGTFPGLRFLAQVKSTESESLSVIRRTSIELEWLEYYRQLSQPVLLVRYSTDRDELYVRWAHGVHLHNAKGEPPKVAIGFDEGQLFTTATPDELVRDVAEFLYWKQDVPTMPLRISIRSDSDMVAATKMARMLRNAPNRPRDLLEFRTGSTALGDISLTLSEDKMVLSAAEVSSVTLHTEGGALTETYSAWLIEAMRASLAIVLDNLGREELAARVLGNAHRLPLMDHSPDLAHRVSELLWKVGNSQGAEALWKRAAYEQDGTLRGGDDEMPEAAFAVIGAFFHLGPSMSEEAAVSFTAEMTSYAELQKQEGQHVIAAMVYAGVAESHFQSGRFRPAFRAMAQARRLDPRIDEDPQFRRDVAATLFELGRYRAAETLYRNIFEDTGLAMTLCRLADVQLMAGNYHNSVNTFGAAYELAVAEQQPFESLWMLRHLIAEIAHASAESQARNSSAASAALESGDIDAALQLDALCTAAWSTRAEQELNAGEQDSALISLAIAAGLDSTRLPDASRAVALGLRIGTGDDAMIEMITLTVLDIGMHRHGVDGFVEAVEGRIEEVSDDAEQHQRLIEALHGILSDSVGGGSTSRWIEGGRLFVIPE